MTVHLPMIIQRLRHVQQEGLVLARLDDADAQQRGPALRRDQRVALHAIAAVEIGPELDQVHLGAEPAQERIKVAEKRLTELSGNKK